MSSKEGLERYKQKKLQKRREQRLESYYRNRNLKEKEYALSDEAVRQRQHREKQEKEQMRRVKETERKRKYRKGKREENINDERQNEDLNMRNTFENRTEKHRALKKLKLALPKSPDRRVTTMVAYLQNSNSPTVRKLQSSKCLKRNCSDCGVKILNFLPCELDTAEFVKWEKFENVSVNVKGNKTIKKLMLVKKESQVGELFSYFRKLIETFPLHQHRATWQNEQFQNLVRNLPEKQCVCVHDFSENYRCSELTEIQSAYFRKTEVSVHVTILHRHALLEYDGPQDAAGGIIKIQADCAILRGQTQIRTAKDLYEYANSFLTQPRSHCKRRIFRYAETIHRDNRLSFKPVPSIRSLHQVRASRDSAKGLINISELSCFCVNCCHHMHDQCSNSIKTGSYTEWEMKREYRADAQENEENEQVSLQELVSVGQLVALYTDDDEEEYYMLKVEKSMETLRIDTMDSWGSLLPAGTPVFRDRQNSKTPAK
ncbi:unnamed protein product [Mytilus coruscus]|uniref:Uncharacterized protein n=1 Tax=Mytilus coruscus TaxID=42192 RepID=A0A6J8E811_MYTCO|nr:unnamed protein product [Mytilus coruscus]